MVESTRRRLSLCPVSSETLATYAEFKERASFGDYLFLNERLITDPDDSRTLAYVASNELGMLMGPMANTILPRYAALGSIHMHRKHIELLQKKRESKSYFGTMAMAMQSLCGVMLGYTLVNDTLPKEEKVNYTVPDLLFIKSYRITNPAGLKKEFLSLSKDMWRSKDEPVVLDPKLFESTPSQKMDLLSLDPVSLGLYLDALSQREPTVYLKFLNGAIQYADYLLGTAAEQKIGEFTLREIVRDPVIAVVDEYLGAAQDQNNKIAEDKLVSLMKDIRSGEAYEYGHIDRGSR